MNRLLKTGFVWAGVLLLLLPIPMQAGVPEGVAEALRAKAISQGKVRLIVRIAAPEIPQGDMGAASRQSILQTMNGLQNGLLARAAQPGLKEIRRFKFIPFMVLSADADAVDTLAQLPQVISIQEDIPEPPLLASSVPIIGAADAWAAGFEGDGQVIAVLDTGVATNHPFFGSGRIAAEACFSTNDEGDNATSLCPGAASSSTAAGSGVNCPTNVSGCDHGTHVAGIALGNDGAGPNIGVAREAQLVSIQVFSRFGSGSFCAGSACALAYQSDQVAALDHVLVLSATLNIAAVNISIGSSATYSSAACDTENSGNGRKMAIDNLRAAGIATIIAAGNSNSRTQLSQPGCISSAISVGNTTDADAIASSSNVASFLSLLAPGSSITSSVPGGGTGVKTGTSMSAPHVAGAWAIVREAIPNATVDEILAVFRDTATSIDDQRSSGSIDDMRRINLDLAIAEVTSSDAGFASLPLPESDLDLGDVAVGANGIAQDIVVSSTGSDELELSCEVQGPGAPVFQIIQCPATIGAGLDDNVSLRCDPVDGGEFSATLAINTNDNENVLVTYGLSCTGLGTEIDAFPVAETQQDFGAILVGTQSDDFDIQISNTGNELLSLSCALTGADIAEFVISACPANVAATQMDTVAVHCSPTVVASFSATLEITSDDGNEPLLSYPLLCQGVEPEIETNPLDGALIDFGDVVVNVGSQVELINVSNTGGANLEISCAASGADQASFSIVSCPAVIEPANNEDIQVRCLPASTVNLAAQLQVNSNDSDEPVLNFDLACLGVAPEFDPDPIAGSLFDFGFVLVDQSSASQNISIANPGTSSLALVCEVQGADAFDYAILQCPASVPAGQSVMIELNCSPLSGGTKLAQLRLVTDDEDEPEALYDLTCKARTEEIFKDGYESE